MRAFFHGWYRKVGCVTLLMAIALMTCWARSFVVRDIITTVPLFGQGHTLSSAVGQLEWVSWKANYPRSQFPAGWRSQRVNHTKLARIPLYQRSKYQMVTVSLAGTNAEGFATPHWTLVAFLSLISACLLIRKPYEAKRIYKDPSN
jgi:hypothetical protein